jgi:hypothetical protein
VRLRWADARFAVVWLAFNNMAFFGTGETGPGFKSQRVGWGLLLALRFVWLQHARGRSTLTLIPTLPYPNPNPP